MSKRTQYKRLERELSDLYEASIDAGGLNHYRLIFPNKVWENGQTVCYADISNDKRNLEGSVALISTTTVHRKYRATVEDCGEYIKWLIQDSVFAECFRRKSVKKTVEQGIICHTNVPSTLLGGAIVSHRMIYENNYCTQIKSWNAMVQGGVNPDLAYLLLFLFVPDKQSELFSFRNTNNGHTPIPSHLSKEVIMNFLNREYDKGVLSFKEKGSYGGARKMWGNGANYGNTSVDDYFQKIFKERFKDRITPFQAVVKGGATAKELAEIVLEYQKKHLKEV